MKLRQISRTFSACVMPATLVGCVLSFGAVAQTGRAGAANDVPWPTKAVKLMVGFPGGSSPDLVARALAEPLSKALGQPVVVENRPGAGGNIAADLVAKSTDNHTIGIMINGNLTIARLLNPKTPFDPAKDLAPISLIGTAPLVLATNAQTSFVDGLDFFKQARAAGNQWNYGTPGNGTVAHIGMEYLKAKTQIDPVHVPFPGNPQVITNMIGGQINLSLLPPGLAMAQIRAGKLKAIGLTSGRSPLAPEIAPLADAEIRNFNLEVWTALVGPANLSRAAQSRLNAEVSKIIRDADTRQKLFNQGWQAVGTSPEGLQLRIKSESASVKSIIDTRNIKAE